LVILKAELFEPMCCLLATSPKSKCQLFGNWKAQQVVKQTGDLPVPDTFAKCADKIDEKN
jgi:hypothetical protein